MCEYWMTCKSRMLARRIIFYAANWKENIEKNIKFQNFFLKHL